VPSRSALALSPGDADALSNLELARTLTTDAIEPLPRFWLLDVVNGWLNLLPSAVLAAVVAFGWLLLASGAMVRVLARGDGAVRWATRVALAGAAVVLVLGTNVLVRELGLGQPERGVVLTDVVPVRSAPSDDDDLTLFEVHEGTRVRVDQRTGAWAEIVLDDGKVVVQSTPTSVALPFCVGARVDLTSSQVFSSPSRSEGLAFFSVRAGHGAQPRLPDRCSGSPQSRPALAPFSPLPPIPSPVTRSRTSTRPCARTTACMAW
jgi:hypothetical protein